MLPLFTLTIFLSAALLFFVQPMVAKMMLPLLGGSPAVWNTCMVFFQAVLLAGYAYSHYGPRLLGERRHAVLHLLLMLAPLAVLPIALPRDASPSGQPTLWLLGALVMTTALPFFVVSTSGPLLQRWFAGTGHRAAGDPYFLYAASNAGSLLALLAYPFVVEPIAGVRTQSAGWSVVYLALVGLTTVCAVAAWRGARTRRDAADTTHTENLPEAGAASTDAQLLGKGRQRVLWVLLAFVPSSLMLGATQYISTDIAAVPLLWVVPLSIYLLSFIVAFARRRLISAARLSEVLVFAILAIAVALLANAEQMHLHILGNFVLHLLTLTIAATYCHTRLADLRPPPSRLTEFYLWLAVGGVLGGMFNALLAPVLFSRILEYPIALTLLCFLRIAPKGATAPKSLRARLALDLGGPLAILLLTLGLALAADDVLHLEKGPVRAALVLGLPAVACAFLARRPPAFAAAIACVFAIAFGLTTRGDEVLARRTFFGVYRVNRNDVYTTLVHGTTVHGLQYNDQAKQGTPLSYYHPQGPIGQVFGKFGATDLFDRVALVGLGSGALAAYGREGQTMVFHEIDPAVIEIAGKAFTYLDQSKASLEYVVGDGRLTLDQSPDGSYGLIVLDAFSSDAIPVHLITREALELYVRKLRPGGIIAFHVSNQYLALSPVVGKLAESLGLSAVVQFDEPSEAIADSTLRYASEWVLVARSREDFGTELLKNVQWRAPEVTARTPLWTDEFSNIARVFIWP